MADYFRPGMVAHTYLGTFTDFVDYLSIWSGGSTNATSQVMIRQAVITAYRALIIEREWKYFATDGRIVTNAPYSTGTVQYTQSDMQMRLTGGTWPDWAGSGRIVIGNQIHDVSQLLNNVTLVLSPQMNPGEDLAAGTSYTLYQNVYDLPADFRSLRQAITANNFNLAYLPQQEFVWRERRLRNSGYPQMYSMWPNPNAYGVTSLALYPYPSTAMIVDVPYQRFARPIKHTGYDSTECTGTVANTGTAVTGTGTSFTSNMVGSVLRLGTATDYPSATSAITAYQDQQIIAEVIDATHLTLAGEPDQDNSGAKFRISDPIDMPEFMAVAFMRRCELEAARNLRMDRLVPQADIAYREALIGALEGDNQSLGTRDVSGGAFYQWWNLGPLLPGQG